MAVTLMAIFFVTPDQVNAASQSVTVGSLVITTTHEEGLIKDVDYVKRDLRYDGIILTTEKPVTITLKEGKTLSQNPIVINNAEGVSTADVTFSNLNLKTVSENNIAIWGSGAKGPFDVKLTFTGENTLKSNHSSNAAVYVQRGNVTIQGGKITTNSNFTGKGNLTFKDISLKFSGSGAEHAFWIEAARSTDKELDGDIVLDNVDVTTYSNTRHFPITSKYGKITIKDCDLRRCQTIDAPKGIVIEKSKLNMFSQYTYGVLRSNKGDITVSDTTGNLDADFETNGVLAPQGTVTILRSDLNTRTYGLEKSYAISAKKIKITSSILSIRDYHTGLKAKSDGITITSSKINIDADKKAIDIGPQKSGSIPLTKLSLSNSKLANGAKKGRYSTSSGSYLTVKTSSGNTASDAEILLTKPSKPVITLTAMPKKGKIKVSWTKAPVNTKYQVWRATSKTGKYTLVKTTTLGYYSDADIKAGKTYYYKVRAVSGTKLSNYSNVKSMKL